MTKNEAEKSMDNATTSGQGDNTRKTSRKKVPEWVGNPLRALYSSKKIGENYFLFENIRRQTLNKRERMQIMRGIIVPHGVLERIEGNHMECSVYEYGFSMALIQVCPLEWKNDRGVKWYEYMLAIIAEYSPSSYLLRGVEMKPTGKPTGAYLMELKNCLKRRGLSFELLYKLFGNLYVVYSDKAFVVKPSQAQLDKAKELGIILEPLKMKAFSS